MPVSWTRERCAGKEWAIHFRKRHPDITLRTPEPTSLARMTCFNKNNVGEFYDNLSNVMDKFAFSPENIYNIDETGTTTVQAPTKQLAETGTKRVGAATSGEKGDLVTVCCAVSAIGNRLPPFCIFPRVKTQDHWIDNLPVGSAVEGHPKATGWMTTDNFFYLS